MNIEGRALLEKFGFNPPMQNRVIRYDEVSKINLEQLYAGSRCGASIEVAPAYMKLSHGPNPEVKLHGEHSVPQNLFFDAFDRVVFRAREKGFAPNELRFAVCQSIPHTTTISGICARVDEDGFGYLACEILQGVRSGDFTPDYSIEDKIVGGRPMAHTRQKISGEQQFPIWVVNQMYRIMRKMNKFDAGIAGVEFVFDTELKRPIFHDMYWSLKPHQGISQKFHLSVPPLSF